MNVAIEFYLVFSIILMCFSTVFVIFKSIQIYKITSSHGDISFKNVKNLVKLEDKESKKEQIIDVIDCYFKKSDYEKAYYMYALSEINISDVDEIFKEKVLSFLETKSVYVLVNAMKAIYKISDVELLLKAIKKLEKESIFYHTKLLTDGLCSMENPKLAESLSENFGDFQENTKIAILDFCRIKNIQIKIHEISMINMSSNEVKYAYLRYKQVGNDDMFYEKILDDKTSNWIEKMLALRGLKDKGLSEKYAKMYVANGNFNLRQESIYKLKNDKELLLEVMKRGDKYTNEGILYALQKEEEYC